MSEEPLIDSEDFCDGIEVEVLTGQQIQEWARRALADAGCSWEELQEQAAEGRFETDLMRETWFLVSSLVRPVAARAAVGPRPRVRRSGQRSAQRDRNERPSPIR